MLYLRPIRFADTPVGAEPVARLAGGLQWFAALEVIAVEGGRRRERIVPVGAWDAFLGALPDPIPRRRRSYAARRRRSSAKRRWWTIWPGSCITLRAA
ncbi:MAG: hypothetical protein A4S16_08735 [Proteobacteria bacterium SG_bin6]|nr:MAG: hypothetical protein A4S16_08735 [Proteobacteria bacterium SG_bin6]